MDDDSQLDSLLKQMAEDHRPQIPSPGMIWWRAQILRKQREQARIERPVKIMRMVAVVVCLVVLAFLVTQNGELRESLLGRESWLLLPLGVVLLMASLVSVSLLWPSAKRR
jgi:ABC-type transport system involved in cytochrome c biogenesis permease subunit